MKHLFLLLSLLAGLIRPTAAQIDTTGGQFHQPLYPVPSVTAGVAYGSAPNSGGTTLPLLMDIYQPVGAPAAPRPLIILVHGGAFLGGSRTDYDVQELCRRFARLGYVTASIDYRLESFFTFSGSRAVVNAVHDLRAAVRFFRQDAATANQYNINPLYIFAGGSSAGAITAVHAAYLDKDAELAALNAPGVAPGLEGSSGNPGYSSAIGAGINLCGAIGNLSWLEAGDEPLVSVHGTTDGIVPYGTGPTFTGDVVNGSGAIQPRAAAVGVPNTLRTFRGAGHVPYNGTSAAQLAYMDTTFRTVRDFLRPLLVAAAPLPVRLTSFTAERQDAGVLLRWQTAQEENSAGYAVEVSADGRSFRHLGFVASRAPYSTTPTSYRFVDREAGGPGLRYYRLRQLDLDGKEAFYGPQVLRFGAEAPLAVYPNPVSGPTATALVASTGGGVLELRDALGRLVSRQTLPAAAGPSQRVALPELASRPPGVYHLLLRDAAGAVQQVRLLKQ
ncbi:alpha/beta hydrolase fold domain-containing protein [Hymenobacter edaphi]|uniref:BD-FAE-like domain-containing protein n=1 Tax=Hymenobacter edaphi TaxID=2211146 RepID=A0A328BP39_9BACT|nr:alpha/beta hydrolase fold domain-containing protein [Hymenobacter edaphi]RAK68389.1 hypothetical protein DLM85_10245 [Hymenobacter edaphi]